MTMFNESVFALALYTLVFCTAFNHRQWSFHWPGEDGGWLEVCHTPVVHLVWWLTASGQISEAACTNVTLIFVFPADILGPSVVDEWLSF